MANRSRTFTIVAIIALGCAAVGALGPPAFLFGPALIGIALLGGAAIVLYRLVGGGQDEDPARMVARAALVAIALIAALGAATGIGVLAALGGGVAEAIIAVAAGIGLIAAGLLGGPRWLILPVIVLVMPLAVVTAADLNLRGGVGQRHYRPATVADLQSRYRLGAGQIDLDLRQLKLPEGQTNIDLSVGMGEAIVRAPQGACVAVDGQIGACRADATGAPDQGLDVDVADRGSGARVVHVQADVGIGHLKIQGACA